MRDGRPQTEVAFFTYLLTLSTWLNIAQPDGSLDIAILEKASIRAFCSNNSGHVLDKEPLPAPAMPALKVCLGSTELMI